MDEFEKMAIAQLKVIIASEPCAVGMSYNHRHEYAKRLWNGEKESYKIKRGISLFQRSCRFQT